MERNFRNALGFFAVVLFLTGGVGAEESLGTTSDESLTAVEKIRQGFGIGLIVGEPTGLSAKKWLSDATAIDAAVA